MSQFFKTREETQEWLNDVGIQNYKINKDLTVDVNDDVNISHKNLDFIPVKFRKVLGAFDCNCNNLTSLEGCPESSYSFYCFDNKLSSLKGSPKEISSDFDCSCNELTSLEGSPEYVGGGFNCVNNKLTSLKGCPTEIGDGFSFYNNKIESLEFFPEIVSCGLIISNDELLKLYPNLSKWSDFKDIQKERQIFLASKEKSHLAQEIESPKSKEQTKPRFKI